MTRWTHPNAGKTAEFGAMRTETSIRQLFHANEAAENFI